MKRIDIDDPTNDTNITECTSCNGLGIVINEEFGYEETCIICEGTGILPTDYYYNKDDERRDNDKER